MERTDQANEPAPNVLLMLAMAAGMWGLVYLGVASVWPRGVDRSDLAVEGRHVPQLASVTDQPVAKLPTRTTVKTKRKRRVGPSFAQRVFGPSASLN
jgi:hypothetical protein